MMRDKDFGIVRVRAYGTFDFRIVDTKLFLSEVAGTDHQFRLDEFMDTMRSRVVSVFSDALASANVPVLDVASRYQELGEALLPLINPAMTGKYGLEIPSFIVENVSVPPEVEQAIDKRASMAAVGNLNDYVKFQMAESMTKGEGGGMASSAAQLGAGLAMGQQMAAAMSAAQNTPPVAPSGAVPPPIGAGGGLPELLSPARCGKSIGRQRSRRAANHHGRDAQGQEDRQRLSSHALRPGGVPQKVSEHRSCRPEEVLLPGLRSRSPMESAEAGTGVPVLRHTSPGKWNSRPPRGCDQSTTWRRPCARFRPTAGLAG